MWSVLLGIAPASIPTGGLAFLRHPLAGPWVTGSAPKGYPPLRPTHRLCGPPPCPIAGSQVKASPRFSNEKRRKSKVDEARDILAHVVVCHVAAPKYNFTHKLAYVSVRPGQSL